MNGFVSEVIKNRVDRTKAALEKNGMEVFYADNRKDAAEKVRELLNEGDVIGVGGSETLNECGILDIVREEKYNFIDRYEKGISGEETYRRHVAAMGADVYISGTNAVTEEGSLYNVDGNGNRIAAIAFGPKKVIIIAGYNKIVKNIDEAVKRVKACAAPANTKRLGCQTYCQKAGECMALAENDERIDAGCHSDGRICCDYLISAKQRRPGRIKVILVGESLGF